MLDREQVRKLRDLYNETKLAESEMYAVAESDKEISRELLDKSNEATQKWLKSSKKLNKELTENLSDLLETIEYLYEKVNNA
mgnify:CR=1 FL=1